MVKIKIEKLTFYYDEKAILDDITIEANAGEFLSIVGPNGAGKTTLLRCIDKILKPKFGTIFFDGKDIAKIKANELAKMIGFLPQSEPYSFQMSVFDVVIHGRKPYVTWRYREEDVNKVKNILKLLEIENLSDRNILELSGGERQKVLLARTLVQETEVILLDEPCANLDLKYQHQILYFIKKICTQNNIIAFVAIHDLNLAARYSDRMILLKEGKIFAKGKPEEVITSINIKEVYKIDVEIKKEKNYIYIIPH